MLYINIYINITLSVLVRIVLNAWCTATLSFVLTHSSGRLLFLKFPNTCFIYLVYGKGTIEQLLKGGMNSGTVSRVSFQCSLGSTYSRTEMTPG